MAKITIPCNETKKEIGILNYLKVISIPAGVTVQASFVESPRDEELYPLTDTVKYLDYDETFSEAQRCFLHIDGASAENIVLVGANIAEGTAYVDIEQLGTVALESSTKTAIEALAATLTVNLAKEINPYQKPTRTTGNSNVIALTSVLSKTLTCDKIRVTLTAPLHNSTFNSAGKVLLLLNGAIVNSVSSGGTTGDASNASGCFEHDITSGDTIEIKISTSSTNFTGYFLLEEFDLKV